MTKILFVISTMGIGGAETVFYDTALGLSRHKDEYDVSVVCLYERGKIGRRLAEKGIEVCDCILKDRFDIKGMAKFINILKEKKPDVLYIAGQTLAQAASFVASLFVKIPVKIIGVHSHDIARRQVYKLVIDKLTFSSASNIICVSESQKEHVAVGKHLSRERIKVIYNGVDVDRFKIKKRIDNGFSIPEGAVVIGAVASLRKEKGLDVLIHAIPDILRRCPDVYFVIAGEGKERYRLENMAKVLGVGVNVRFLGQIEDVSGIIPIFDIGCLSSRTENFPLSILEYMACGKPVVASRVGGVPEMIKDGVNGFLVKPGSSGDLSEKIVSLVNDESLRRSMGMEGRKMVEGTFTLDKMVNSHREFFKQVQA